MMFKILKLSQDKVLFKRISLYISLVLKKMSFNEHVVIVTGASSGIGAAAAVKFAEEGAYVVIVARNENKLNDVATECAKRGKKALVIVEDLVKETSAKNIIDTTITHFGKLNILINNAGICEFLDITSKSVMKAFDEIIDINLRAAVRLTNLSVPHLIESRGNIVNITSIAAKAVLYPGNFAYCASKAGLDNFTRAAALDLGSHGVRVNAVSPGPTRTDFIDLFIPDKTEHDKFWDTVSKRIVLGKVIEPEEVADLILYLASDKARSITGSSFVIDGGMLLKN